MHVRATLVTLAALTLTSPALAGGKNPLEEGGKQRRGVPVGQRDVPRPSPRPAPRPMPAPRPTPAPRNVPAPRPVPAPAVRRAPAPTPFRTPVTRGRAPDPAPRTLRTDLPRGQRVPDGGQPREEPRTVRSPLTVGAPLRTRTQQPPVVAPRSGESPAPGFRSPPGRDRDGDGRVGGAALRSGESPARELGEGAGRRGPESAGRPLPSGTSPSAAGGAPGLLRDVAGRRGKADGVDGAHGRAGRAGEDGPGRDGFVRSGRDGLGLPSGSAGVAATAEARERRSSDLRSGERRDGHSWSRSGDESRDYRDAWRHGYRHGYRVGYDDGHRDRYHSWYDLHRSFLSFHFSLGAYLGVRYYSPFRHWHSGHDYAFFYPEPVSYVYVPWGFYCDTTPVYVTRSVYVRRTVPVVVYETRETVTYDEVREVVEAEPAAEAVDGGAVEPVPVAGTPATEKFLRDGSERFRAGEYYEAAVQFRLAALSAPSSPAPLFALSQALMALGQDAYGARVLRKALELNPGILEEPADIAGVYRDQAEFERVTGELEARAAAAPSDGDARLLLGAVRYFTGDPRARQTFEVLGQTLPEDPAVGLFRSAVESRFLPADALPEIVR